MFVKFLVTLTLMFITLNSALAKDFLRHYIVKQTAEYPVTNLEPLLGVPENGATYDPLLRAPVSDVLITEALWFGPAASLDFFVWEAKSHDYKLGVSPGIGYGIHWKPAWWTATDAFISLDFYVQMQAITASGSFSYFNVDFIPTLSFFDWFGVGVGLRTGLPIDKDLSVQTTGMVSLGIRKSI